MKNVVTGFVVTLVVIAGMSIGIRYLKEKKENEIANPSEPHVVLTAGDFDYKVINELKPYNLNALISPLSIAYALSMLKDGAGGETKTEIETALGYYSLPKTASLKDRLGIANAVIVKEADKELINSNYTNSLINNYGAELIYDDFTSADNVNNWVNNKTFGMIPELTKELSKDLEMILINALAIDFKWQVEFQCNLTKKSEFTKVDNTKSMVSMMKDESASYIENEEAKGIVKKYKEYSQETGEETTHDSTDTSKTQFEYIAIMPNGNIDEYLKSLTKEKLDDLLSTMKNPSSELSINTYLPKYTYDFTYKDFIPSLNRLGIIKSFDENSANFDNMVTNPEELSLFVSNAIHKTHIELNETGTKAAAVTAIFMDKASAYEPEKQIIEIRFDKPFIYIIKEVNSSNIWFIGTVYEPNEDFAEDACSK